MDILLCPERLFKKLRQGNLPFSPTLPATSLRCYSRSYVVSRSIVAVIVNKLCSELVFVVNAAVATIENSTLQEQTSETRTQDTRTPTPDPRFMLLSQNITRIHSLHHPKMSRFHGISHTWSYPPSTSREMFHHSQAPSPHLIPRIVKPWNSAPRYYQLHNP